ncbi:MAG: FAD:protein FMN transferase [Flavobacteriales bacterium]
MKTNLYYLLALVLLALNSCGDNSPESTGFLELRGYTQGTTYQIIYKDSLNYEEQVEGVLTHIDSLFNLWDSTSVISRLNDYSSMEKVFMFPDASMDFTIMMEISQDIYEKTDKAFDPSLLPLMELWKFGKDETVLPSKAEIDSVKQYTGFTDFDFMLIYNPYEESDTTQIRKTHPNRKLDFNAIAQGYTADLIANMLIEKGVFDFMVNIGGEIKVQGKNPNGENWSIGIQNPSVDDEEAKSIVVLTDCGVATSGSYRNYKEINGSRYSHTIDGRTGMPVTHGLLSCTVIAASAYEADAYATAFMVMGTEAVDEFLRSNPNLGLQVYLIEDIYGEYHVTYTPDFPLAAGTE